MKMKTQTTREYCINHGHQDFFLGIDFDDDGEYLGESLHCPDCHPDHPDNPMQFCSDAKYLLLCAVRNVCPKPAAVMYGLMWLRGGREMESQTGEAWDNPSFPILKGIQDDYFQCSLPKEKELLFCYPSNLGIRMWLKYCACVCQ